MHRLTRTLAVCAASLAAAACTSSYHPEYHPVSVSNVNLSSPVMVNTGGSPDDHAPRAPVYVVPAPPGAALTLAPPPPPPPGFFERQ